MQFNSYKFRGKKGPHQYFTLLNSVVDLAQMSCIVMLFFGLQHLSINHKECSATLKTNFYHSIALMSQVNINSITNVLRHFVHSLVNAVLQAE